MSRFVPLLSCCSPIFFNGTFLERDVQCTDCTYVKTKTVTGAPFSGCGDNLMTSEMPPGALLYDG